MGEVGLVGYNEKQRGAPDWIVARQTAKAFSFEMLASILLPMTIIHQSVHVAQGVFERVGRFQKWGPSMAGLALLPFLPIIDEPIEQLTEWCFDRALPLPEDYVRDPKKHE